MSECGWYIDTWSSGEIYLTAFRFGVGELSTPLAVFARWFAGILGGIST